MPTLAGLRAIARRDKTFSDTALLATADLDTILIEGALDMAQRGHALPLTATFNTVASTQKYVLTGASPKLSNYLDIFWETGGIIYTDASGNLQTHPSNFQVVSEAWLDLNVPNWRNDSASDTLQHVYFSYDASGYFNLGVHPKSSTATPIFTIHYLSRGTDMAAAGDFPWVTGFSLTHLEPYMKGISYYALWRLHDEISLLDTLATKYLGLYVAMAEEMREKQDAVFLAKLKGLSETGQLQSLQTFGSLR